MFQIGMILSVVVWGTLCLFTAPFPYRWRFWAVSRWCHWIGWWLKVTCGIRHEVEGTENIPREAGVVMAKHQSSWETFALELWFYPQTWVLKRELMWLPIFGWCLALLEPIAIDRSAGREAVRQVVEQGGARMRKGRWVVVFPEGTRVPAGSKGRYGKGGAVLAFRTGALVVPVAHNAGELWPKKGLRKRKGTVRVRIGKPVRASDYASSDALMRDVEEWIEAQMPEISELGYEGTAYQRKVRGAG